MYTSDTGLFITFAFKDSDIYTKDYKVKLFRRVYVSIGKPRTFEDLGFTGARDDYDRISNEIFTEICNLCNSAKESRKCKKKESK